MELVEHIYICTIIFGLASIVHFMVEIANEQNRLYKLCAKELHIK